MSEHYGICARCNKNLIIKKSDDYYFSEIDGKGLCKECWQKEQPKELSKRIVELQSQLAEKDEEIKYYELEWKGCQQKLDHYIGECINLQDEQNQKAIEELEKLFYETDNIYHTNEMDKMWLLDYIKATIFKLKGNAENEKCIKSELAEKDKEQNQKATEQLEKVRERLKHFCEIHSDEYYSVKSQVMGIYQDVCEFIDQQINELKGEKHYVHT